jgi:hypothetical protein
MYTWAVKARCEVRDDKNVNGLCGSYGWSLSLRDSLSAYKLTCVSLTCGCMRAPTIGAAHSHTCTDHTHAQHTHTHTHTHTQRERENTDDRERGREKGSALSSPVATAVKTHTVSAQKVSRREIGDFLFNFPVSYWTHRLPTVPPATSLP